MSDRLTDLVARHTAGLPGPTGAYPTAVEALCFYRADAPSEPLPMLYEPSLCVVVQGSKRATLGETVLDYGPGQCLVAAVDLPLASGVTQASVAEPYLSLVLTLDPVLLADVALLAGRTARPAGLAEVGVFTGALGAETAGALSRLVGLLDRPEAIPALYEPTVRELYYELLTGPDGDAFARLALPDGPTRRVARAVGAMRAAFPGPIRVDALADEAGMSPSAFGVAFRAVTAMSPLQYYKRLRLLEARRLLAAGAGVSAQAVAYEVGYESASQFSREYARLFGAPPRRDIRAVRASVA